jgi:LPXTG-motif cell wall-anchored protein
MNGALPLTGFPAPALALAGLFLLATGISLRQWNA